MVYKSTEGLIIVRQQDNTEFTPAMTLAMDFLGLPNAVKIAIGLASIYILYLVFLEVTIGRSRRSLQREKGTLPVPWYSGFWDHVLGLDLFLGNIKRFKEHRALEGISSRFHHDKANTLRMINLGQHVHMTLEYLPLSSFNSPASACSNSSAARPENLKYIQAIDFKKWGLGSRRKYGFRPLLGEGGFACTLYSVNTKHLTRQL